jgi:hypothetical protein
MTYGQIRFLLTKALPGVDPDLLDGWIQDRYTRILDRLKWSRLELETAIQTVAPYQTGTVAVTAGSNAVTLTGGTWTTAMTGRAFRVDGRSEYYEFTRASATTGTLDRNYEGDTAAAATYKIVQFVYALPSDCRMLAANPRLLDAPAVLDRLSSRGELNASAPGRPSLGTPRVCAPYMDAASDPPVMQIELYPIPDDVYGIAVPYIAEQADLSSTSTTLLPWLRPGCLKSGVLADGQKHLKDWNAADRYERDFESQLTEMAQDEARRKGPQPMRAADWMVRHRVERALRSVRNPRILP